MTTVDVSVIGPNDCVMDVVANHGADIDSSKDHCLDYPHVDGDMVVVIVMVTHVFTRNSHLYLAETLALPGAVLND